MVRPEFGRLHSELESRFEDVTDRSITRAMGSDGDDKTLGRHQLSG